MDAPIRSAPPLIGLRFFIVGGGVISFAAGMVNAITIVSVFEIPTTHMTGMLTQLAVEGIGVGHTFPFTQVAWVVGGFITGAAISGAVLQSSRLRLSHRYGMLLLFESALLLGATYALHHEHFAGVVIAALAAGLQNALATQYSGAILRTTHITGVVTDLGIALGRWLRGRRVDAWRVYLHLAILTGFGLGSIAGTVSFLRAGALTMLLPATIILVCALVYWRKRSALDDVSEALVETTHNA